MSRKGWKEWGDAITRLSQVSKNPKYLTEAGNFVLNAAKLNCSGFIITSGELRGSLGMTVTEDRYGLHAHIGTNKAYATYVEFGTGPKGAAHHNGIAPDVAVAYTLKPWWIHESQVSPGVAAVYRWPFIETPEGRFYKVSGQPAHPYLYPAFADNKDTIAKILAGGFKEAVKG